MSDGFSEMLRDIKEKLLPQCRALALTNGPHGNCCVLREDHDGKHRNWSGTEFTRCVYHGAELHDEIAKLCRCDAHRRYKARRKPAVVCEGCWRLWALTHPAVELETRWMR